jgi:hypothetical protein
MAMTLSLIDMDAGSVETSRVNWYGKRSQKNASSVVSKCTSFKETSSVRERWND